MDEQVSGELFRAIDGGEAMLAQLTPVVLLALQSRSVAARMACAPFLSAHLARLKTAAKRQNGELSADTQRGLLRVFEARYLR